MRERRNMMNLTVEQKNVDGDSNESTVGICSNEREWIGNQKLDQIPTPERHKQTTSDTHTFFYKPTRNQTNHRNYPLQ